MKEYMTVFMCTISHKAIVIVSTAAEYNLKITLNKFSMSLVLFFSCVALFLV